MKRLHLLCNAHIDPVWMWEKEEGIAETLSTYRVAADFCEQYPDFIFNHNESILYEWVEEYDSPLFERIKKLVAAGRWKIMGGFYLQPDCNIPSGEGMIRQILAGRRYFAEKFDKSPTTAMNFDSFGHSRGLVQILKKAGYDSYIACRPLDGNCPLPADDFIWRGYDGSEIACHRGFNSYESHRGKADKKIREYMDKYPDKEVGMVLWGVGNHGGGPSRIDYERISELRRNVVEQTDVIHSSAESYFEDNLSQSCELPIVQKPLQYHSVGCYTSMIRIKQKYRLLENMLFKVEKMASHAALNGLMEYPAELLAEAEKDMLFIQFHDILPGSCIATAEEASLRQLDHGIEITERVRIKAFLMLIKGEKAALDGEIPIFVHNPHPVRRRTIIECEFNLPDQNTDSATWYFPRVYHNGVPIPCQAEHEQSNFNVDWRKRVVFEADLNPSAISRFDCKLEPWSEEPKRVLEPQNGLIIFKTDDITAVINCATGALDSYVVNGREMLSSGSFIPVVMEDDYDSWGNRTDRFNTIHGRFALMNPQESAAFSGIEAEAGSRLGSVRVIEDGEVRSVVEALFKFENSFACLRYHLPKKGTEIVVTASITWNEKMKMLKLPVITPFKDAKYIGQVMSGRDELPNDGTEAVSQRWNAVVSGTEDAAVTLINNGTYGSDYIEGEMRVSLLRSPGYSAGCSDFSKRKPQVMEQDRCNSFVDQGVREYTFRLNGGDAGTRLNNIETETAFANETPYALSCFTSGTEHREVKPLVELDNDIVQLTAFKKSIYSDSYILRLFEPTGQKQSCTVKLPVSGACKTVELNPFEIVTLEYDPISAELCHVGILEKPVE